MALLMLNEFVKFLGECADRHDGYIMGAVGQDPKTLHEWYFNQYRDRKQYSAKQEAQALKWREEAERVWDCQGLADGYVSEKLGVKVNVRARNNYAAWCGVKGEGKIPNERKVPGAAVFMDNGSYIHHVGFLEKPVDEAEPEGDWWVVEAQGVLYGVVRTKLSRRGWNKWGWMTKYFEYPESEEQPVEEKEYGEQTLKKGMTGEAVAALQRDLIALGFSVGRWGADGEFGSATKSALEAFQLHYGLKVDGAAGWETFSLLNDLLRESGGEAAPEEPEKSVRITAGRTWNIRTQADKGSAIMGIARLGEEYPASGCLAEGWIGILLHGEPAWVSAKAVSA